MAQAGDLNLEGKILIVVGNAKLPVEIGAFEIPIEIITRTESDGLLHLGTMIDQQKVDRLIERIAEGVSLALESE